MRSEIQGLCIIHSEWFAVSSFSDPFESLSLSSVELSDFLSWDFSTSSFSLELLDSDSELVRTVDSESNCVNDRFGFADFVASILLEEDFRRFSFSSFFELDRRSFRNLSYFFLLFLVDPLL